MYIIDVRCPYFVKDYLKYYIAAKIGSLNFSLILCIGPDFSIRFIFACLLYRLLYFEKSATFSLVLICFLRSELLVLYQLPW